MILLNIVNLIAISGLIIYLVKFWNKEKQLKIFPIILIIVFFIVLTNIYYKSTSEIAFSYNDDKIHKRVIDSLCLSTIKVKNNNDSTIILTERLVDNLNYHLRANSDKVDEAIETSKEETNRNIDRITLWVSIWIGVMGLIGTIFPLFLNWTASKDIEKLDEQTRTDKKELKDEIKEFVRSVNKEIEEKLNKTANIINTKFNEQIEAAEKSAKSAEDRAEQAENTSKDAYGKICDASSKVDEIDSKSEEFNLKLSRLEKDITLINSQNQIDNFEFLARFSQNGLDNNIKKYLHNMFINLRKSIHEWSNNNSDLRELNIVELFLRHYIIGLLKLDMFINDRPLQVHFAGLREGLSNLIQQDDNDLKEKHEKVITILDNLIVYLQT